MLGGRPEAFFLARPGGQRYCIHHPPQGPQRGAVLAVHAFAEEMNKSRRMGALQSRALAERGYAVLQIDLLGCGDSSGDFGDATWEAWVDDVSAGAAWLQERHPGAPLTLWGHRVGCLVAAESGRRLARPLDVLFWQPAVAGKLALRQFMRLKTAAAMVKGEDPADAKTSDDDEIAGYRLSAALKQGLDAATLDPWPGIGKARWFELSLRDDSSLLPATQTALQRWQSQGIDASAQLVHGPAFWQATEIETAPALISASCAALEAA